MSEPEQPSLETTELKLGGVSIKGTWIVWFAAIVSSVAGTIYFAGGEWKAFQDMKTFVAEYKPADMSEVTKNVEQIKTIDDNLVSIEKDIDALNEAVSKLNNDMSAISTIVQANDVSKLQGAIATLKTSVEGVSVFTRDVQDMRTKLVSIEKDMQVLKKDVDSQWNAIDTLGAGSLKGGK
jgi:outer membrane murein-binding lipoprotein Lpp